MGLTAAGRTRPELAVWAGSEPPCVFSSPTTLREKVAELDRIPLSLSDSDQSGKLTEIEQD